MKNIISRNILITLINMINKQGELRKISLLNHNSFKKATFTNYEFLIIFWAIKPKLM